MKIAILGSGTVGSALATKLVSTGHEVTLGVRSKRPDLVAPSAPLADAVAGADLVINATPGGQSLEILRSIGARILGDKVLLDVANASNEKFELIYPNDSLARTIQAEFPSLRVVKSLNTMNTSVMTNPSVIAPTTVFLSGNDPEAKRLVGALLEDLGWPKNGQLDLGDVSTARGPEHYFLLFFPTLQALKTPVFNIAVTR
jgi:8-hydroxy-5-deazaflavin:NADPH oxidoreductase